MSDLPYKNPISPIQVIGTSSVRNTDLFGTHFSIYGVGGYMEVYNISDLYYTIPSNTYGIIQNSGNTIPINFFKGSGTSFSIDTLTLNSDLISSGRRRLGMLVYVYETDQIYQFLIDNYDTLWSAATASTGTVISNQYGTIVRANSSANQSFINSWTGNTVEGISGATRSTAVWKKLQTGSGGGGSGITGGTYYPSTLTLDLESTGGTISISSVTGLYISAGTYTSGTSTLNLFNSTGGTISITGITAGSGGSGGTSNFQYFISGSTPTGTINDGDRWFYTESGEEFVWITDQDGSQWVQPVSISYGVSEEFVHITGDTMTGTLYVPTISATTYQNLPVSALTQGNGIQVTNNSGNYTITFTGSSSLSSLYLPLSGGTVTGGTIFTSGVTANTISSVDYIDFDLLSGGTAASAVSRLRYVADEGGLVTTLLGGNIDLQIGQQNVVYCYNGDTVNLSKGQVVAITGNQGNRPRIQRAIASAETTSSTALGIVAETINTGNEGFVTTFGNVRGFNLTGITPGSYVYLSPTTLGGFTGTQPQAPDHIVALGYVVRTGNTQGEIFVNISNGWELNELHNVRITNPSQYDILQYSAGTTPVWYNTSYPFLSGLTATTISATTYQNLPGSSSSNCFTTFYATNISGCSPVNMLTEVNMLSGLTVTGTTSSSIFTGNSLTLSNSASTIYLDNTTAQQIKFYDGGRGTPTYNSYSAGAKIIFTDNISSISSGHAIGVESGSLWYGADLAGNGHEWYAGTRKLASLIGSLGFQIIGLGGPTTTAMVISGTSALGSKGGVGYMDFLQVVNNWSGATNPNKWFRTNSTGGLEILNNAYTATILTLSDSGIMAVAGGNLATTSSNDAQTNYLTFGNNNTQIYDDGNTHIHSRSAGQSMWINTNGGQLNLLTQSTTSTGSIGSGIAIATGTLNGYVTINTGRTVTTAAAYGYLTTAGAGTYPGGSQSVSISLYANNRIWGQEIDAFSDERMKNIEGEISLEEGIKLVNNLKPIKYTWKEGDDKGLKAGYSAQQVIKSGFDHLIGLIPTEGLEETIDEDGFLSPKDTQFAMNYDQVTPYHGVVIKHLLEEIENLKQEIKELKNKIK